MTELYKVILIISLIIVVWYLNVIGTLFNMCVVIYNALSISWVLLFVAIISAFADNRQKSEQISILSKELSSLKEQTI